MAKPFSSLKNSGNFRLIKSIEAANKMMDYHNKVSLVYLLESINDTEFTQYKTVAVKFSILQYLIRRYDWLLQEEANYK